MRYPPVNVCIYCGDTSSELTDEHVIMAAIDGSLVLPKASCGACAAKTSKDEMFVTRNMWGAYRVANGMGRAKKKARPSEFQLRFTDPDGTAKNEHVPLEKVPLIFQFPVLPPPKVLTGKPLTHIDMKVVVLNPEVLTNFSGRKLEGPPIDLPTFSRVLAKTALAYAVAVKGLGSFEPVIREAIVGGHPSPQDFVGRLGTGVPPMLGSAHTLRIIHQPLNGRTWLAVGVSFFAAYGAPEYGVVVGTENPLS